MNAGWAWLAGALLLPLAGAPLLTHPGYRAFPLPARAVLSGAAGAVLLSFVMTLSALVSIPWNVPVLLGAAAAGALALRALLPSGAAPPRQPPVPADRAEARVAGILAALAVAIALAATVSGTAGSPDLLLFWGPKARAFAAAGTIDARFLTDPRTWYMHAYYPPLVTNLFAFQTRIAGSLPWTSAVLSFPLVLGALAIALPAALRLADRPVAPDATGVLAIAALGLAGASANVAGNADVFLWFFEILGLALLLAPRPLDAPRLLLAGVFLAGAATAKVEGLPFAAAAIVAFALGRPRPRSGSLLLLAVPPAAALGAWFAFGLTRRVFAAYGEYGSPLASRWDRLGLALRAIARALAASGYGLPYLVPPAVLLLLIVLRRATLRPVPVAVAALVGTFLLIVYLAPVPDPLPWIRWSAARTFAPIPVVLLLAARAAAKPAARIQADSAG